MSTIDGKKDGQLAADHIGGLVFDLRVERTRAAVVWIPFAWVGFGEAEAVLLGGGTAHWLPCFG